MSDCTGVRLCVRVCLCLSVLLRERASVCTCACRCSSRCACACTDVYVYGFMFATETVCVCVCVRVRGLGRACVCVWVCKLSRNSVNREHAGKHVCISRCTTQLDTFGYRNMKNYMCVYTHVSRCLRRGTKELLSLFSCKLFRIRLLYCYVAYSRRSFLELQEGYST